MHKGRTQAGKKGERKWQKSHCQTTVDKQNKYIYNYHTVNKYTIRGVNHKYKLGTWLPLLQVFTNVDNR